MFKAAFLEETDRKQEISTRTSVRKYPALVVPKPPSASELLVAGVWWSLNVVRSCDVEAPTLQTTLRLHYSRRDSAMHSVDQSHLPATMSHAITAVDSRCRCCG